MNLRWISWILFAAPAFAAAGDDERFFESRIRPLLAAKCFSCHSDKVKTPFGGLRLDTRAGFLKGADSGPVAVAGKPDQSRLIQAVRGQTVQMPPTGKLPQTEIEALEKWIAAGAVWPAEPDAPPAASAPLDVMTRGKDHWAWLPLRVTKPEGVKDGAIDHFVRARLQAEGLEPSPPASPRTLLRRLSYDLTGLPPSIAETQAFEKNSSEAAYAKVVDRLLASPAFGERWGRYWLDVARYADSGFLNNRFPLSFEYRDWVVAALNRDLPYDQFVIRQLAADKLLPKDRKDLAALGFLALGTNLPRAEDLPERVDDRIDVVSRGLLGLTVSCARCHDHKYDPIPARDYYSLFGVFSNTRFYPDPVALGTGKSQAPAAGFYEARLEQRRSGRDDFMRQRIVELRADFREPAELKRYLEGAWEARNLPLARLDALARERNLNQLVLGRWVAYMSDASKSPAFAKWREAVKSGAANGAELVSEYAKRLSAADRAEPFPDPAEEQFRAALRGPDAPTEVPLEDFTAVMTEGDSNSLRQLQWQFERILGDYAWRGSLERAMAVTDEKAIRQAHVFIRGNQNDIGDRVERCLPQVLARENRPCFSGGSGRLELARAIVNPQNPVAARVAVNRVWQHLFGEGLVRTPSDFGLRGEKPSHPELLDFLAAEFMRDGWSVKRLIRRIVTSSTYRQQSADRAECRAKDPENRLLWRMNRRRLDFEALRDSMLLTAGKLDRRVGGPPVSITAEPADPRRTLYAFIERERPLALLKTFDVADAEQHSPQRHQTTVPQQGLFLLNSPFVGEMAEALAGRAPDVAALYRAALARAPGPEEQALAERFLAARTLPAPAPEARSAWQYGMADLDPTSGRVREFRPFRYFTGTAWQGASLLPDEREGPAYLTAGGGAPGDDLHHAVARRWVSPVSGCVRISGALTQNVGQFAQKFRWTNGIRGWIVSSRSGVLGSWTLDRVPPAKEYKNNEVVKAEIDLKAVEVQAGETIDFIVDARDDYEADDFNWAPVIESPDSRRWDAAKEFAGPPPRRLGAMAQLAQVLLLTNEFAFLD